MIPPEWARIDSLRLTLDEFQSWFSDAWSKVDSRFLKLECWQSYQEIEGGGSQEAYARDDIVTARDLLRQEAEADRPLYEDIRDRGIDYARIRLVQEPVTAYLKYELMAYEIRAAMGENIEVVRFDPALRLPSEDHFDFLLFDRHTALIHDYGSGDSGLQTGGWLTHSMDVITSLEREVLKLRRNAVPLLRYLAESQH
jgi:hypothetical protein